MMRLFHLAFASVVCGAAFSPTLRGQAPTAAERAQIDAFNRALENATRHMDNAASLALWADDGVSLLPSADAIVGKKAIAQYLNDVMTRIAGSKMNAFTIRCFDVQVSGPLASEWCIEHQVVTLPDGKLFDGWGKMAFVLRRGADGAWRMKQEAWLPALPSDSLRLR